MFENIMFISMLKSKKELFSEIFNKKLFYIGIRTQQQFIEVCGCLSNVINEK